MGNGETVSKNLKGKLYTIGHSNHEINEFLKMLRENKIEQLIDVRSAPYSKYSPQFNQNQIKKSLETEGIEYHYLGKKIGGRPSNKDYYKDDKVIYSLVEMDSKYKEGIKQLQKFMENKRTVLMCSEEDPHKCHRHKLITLTLLKKRYKVSHIRGNGETEEVQDRQSTLF